MLPLSPELKKQIEKSFGKPAEWGRKLSLIKVRKLGSKLGIQKTAVKGMSKETLLPLLIETWSASERGIEHCSAQKLIITHINNPINHNT